MPSPSDGTAPLMMAMTPTGIFLCNAMIARAPLDALPIVYVSSASFLR